MNYSEAELAGEIAKGNSGAFDQLYRQLYPALYMLTFRLCRAEDVAKDIVADVFLQVWEGRVALSTVHNIKGLLYVSARNRTLNYLKSKGAQVKTITENTDEPFDDSFYESLFETEMIRQLHSAVNALPAECKKVVELMLKGHSTNDIARILNISASAVSHQKARAAKLLKGKMLLLLLLFSGV